MPKIKFLSREMAKKKKTDIVNSPELEVAFAEYLQQLGLYGMSTVVHSSTDSELTSLLYRAQVLRGKV